jgi:tetratricopeptide (TPR) repeat protein
LLLVTSVTWRGTAEPILAQATAAVANVPNNPPADYPPLDGQVWFTQRRLLVSDAASRALQIAPNDVATLDLLLQAERIADALDVLERIVGTRPDQILPAFERVAESTRDFLGQRQHGYDDRLRALLPAAHKRVAELPREERARAARALIPIENMLSGGGSPAWVKGLRRFIESHAGTQAALLAEVDVLVYDRAPERIDAFQALADAHPGTEVAASALYQKGFQLSHNVRDPRGDPTERFLQLLAVVRELETGPYPATEWKQKAPALVSNFSSFNPTYAPENIDRMIDAYGAFILSHFTVDDASVEHGLGYVITSRIVELYGLKGDAIGGVEGLLSELERRAADPSAVRYLKALFYAKWMDPQRFRLSAEPPVVTLERGLLFRKAKEVLQALQADGSDLFRRKALATIASLDLYERNYAGARAAYRSYLDLHPQSAWAWLAALRVGQCDEALEDWDAAASSYADAATKHGREPLARILGHAFAARAREARGRFDDALREHRQALDAWSGNRDTSLYLPTTYRSPPEAGTTIRVDRTRISREALTDRVTTLTQVQALPGGMEVERGRWLIENGRPEEARVVLERSAAMFPASPVTSEARTLAHRARLDLALALADIERDEADEAKAIAELDALAREPYDFIVWAAKIAKASILWTRSRSDEARIQMGAALDEWRKQPSASQPPAIGSLERDVLDIRDVVFRPSGDGVYSGARWNAYEPPASSAQFVIANSRLRVKLANGVTVVVDARRPVNGLPQLLFLSDQQIATLDAIMKAVGGTRRRAPRAIMETPNQPVGPSTEVLALWNTFFAARPGHWGGWVFETYPIVGQIEFLNAERTKAGAAITMGYSGATVVLEKENGIWRATGLVNQWVT